MIRHDDFMEVPDGWGFAAIITRRDFLALTATGLVVMVALERFLAGQEPVRLPQGRQGYPTDLNAYLHVGADGRVTCTRPVARSTFTSAMLAT